MTVKEVAEYLHCDPEDVESMIRGLPSYRHFSRERLVHFDDLINFIKLIKKAILKEIKNDEPKKNQEPSNPKGAFQKPNGAITGSELAKEIGCSAEDIKTLADNGLKVLIHGRGCYINRKEYDNLASQHPDIVASLAKNIPKIKKVGPEGIIKEVPTKPVGYITGKEAGDILGLSPKEIKLLIEQGELIGLTHGRGSYLNPADVQAFKEQKNNINGQKKELLPESDKVPELNHNSNQKVENTSDYPSGIDPDHQNQDNIKENIQLPVPCLENNISEKVNNESNIVVQESDNTPQDFDNNGEDKPMIYRIRTRKGYNNDLCCTVDEVMRTLNVNHETISRWVRDGKVKIERIPRSPSNPRDPKTDIVIKLDDLKNFLSSQLPNTILEAQTR